MLTRRDPLPLLLSLTVALTGCGESASPDGGARPSPSEVSSCEPTIASLAETLFGPACTAAGCHGGESPAGGLSLEGDPTLELVGAASGTCGGWTLVTPGSPEESLLWHKVYSTTAPCGVTMPPTHALSAVELDCIREWIRSATPVDTPQGCETCGTADCVDLATNADHCGACGEACPAGSACASSACECAGALSACGTACVDLESNLEHCGACDASCAPGAVCNVGRCLCAGGLTACGDACVDVTSDAAHCGACGNSCSGGEVCLRGVCSTGCDTLTQCGSSCVDTSSSTLNCGACDVICPGGASCVGGACACPTGTSECAGGCINTTSDPSNCGGCGIACSGGLVCESGGCQCPGGGTPCGAACVDVAASPSNCGACGNVCGAGQTCEAGACVCSGGTANLSSDVQPIFDRSCATRGCHTGIRPQAGLDLSAGRSFAELVGVPASQCSSRMRVTPGDPSTSYLMQKLLGVNLCEGTQMPKSGQSIGQADLDAIGAWICSGAPND